MGNILRRHVPSFMKWVNADPEPGIESVNYDNKQAILSVEGYGFFSNDNVQIYFQ